MELVKNIPRKDSIQKASGALVAPVALFTDSGEDFRDLDSAQGNEFSGVWVGIGPSTPCLRLRGELKSEAEIRIP